MEIHKGNFSVLIQFHSILLLLHIMQSVVVFFAMLCDVKFFDSIFIYFLNNIFTIQIENI